MQNAKSFVLTELQQLNQEYLQKFGFIFIICASGKSAQEMLDILKIRLENSYQKELRNAAEEQYKNYFKSSTKKFDLIKKKN